MKKHLLYLSIVSLTYSCISVKADISTTSNSSKTTTISVAKQEIIKVMKAQEVAWSNGDLEGFMQGYWKSDSLKFHGRNGLTKGWQNTLNNYKKGYPTKADIGQLKFTISDISKIEGDNYWVMGEYALKRTIGDARGVFIVIFKRINGAWKIIADMSC